MADKTANQQKHGTGTVDREEEKGGQHQQKEQGKTGQQHEQGKREHSKGTQHNK